MKHTEWYFHTVQKYRRGLDRINAKYDAQIEDKEGYRGSPRFESDLAEIAQKRATEIEALRADCRDDFNRCLTAMEKGAKSRPTVPPTPEQLNIIQLLKMKASVSRDELEHAAHGMGECSLALSVLEEIARDHDILGFHAGGTAVSDAFVSDCIGAFAKNARITLTLDRTNQRRALMETNGMGDGQLGTIPGMQSIQKFRIDIDPDSAQSCAERWGGVPAGAYTAFCKAVDGEE